MPVHDVFSKRERRRAATTIDVYKYDELPRTLRVQLVNVLRSVIGPPENSLAEERIYDPVHDAISHEIGTFTLAEGRNKATKLLKFVLESSNVEHILDVLEMALRAAEVQSAGSSYRIYADVTTTPAAAVAEINFRFKENGIGYQYEGGQIVRVDSQFLHAEVVKPALELLSDKRYAGADEEFRNAHKHYREGNYKECMTDCFKAFESTMKAICQARGWVFQKTDTAKTLIDICLKNGLIDSMLLSHVGALRTVLEAGVPTLRNKLSGHGQGSTPVAVPPFYAAYALHLTAANIVFLVSAEKALP